MLRNRRAAKSQTLSWYDLLRMNLNLRNSYEREPWEVDLECVEIRLALCLHRLGGLVGAW